MPLLMNARVKGQGSHISGTYWLLQQAFTLPVARRLSRGAENTPGGSQIPWALSLVSAFAAPWEVRVSLVGPPMSLVSSPKQAPFFVEIFHDVPCFEYVEYSFTPLIYGILYNADLNLNFHCSHESPRWSIRYSSYHFPISKKKSRMLFFFFSSL